MEPVVEINGYMMNGFGATIALLLLNYLVIVGAYHTVMALHRIFPLFSKKRR